MKEYLVVFVRGVKIVKQVQESSPIESVQLVLDILLALESRSARIAGSAQVR